MSIRKIAGLAAGFTLAIGLIGTGVSAQWTKQVTAQENINVGSFGCAIVAADGVPTNQLPAKSVTYQAPDINSSDKGSAPFSFTVKNTGTVPQVLQVSSAITGLPAEFSDLLGATNPVPLAGGDSHTFSAGLTWTALDSEFNGATGNIKYTVNCNEGPVILYTSHGFNGADPGHLFSQVNISGFPANSSVQLAYNYGTPGWWVTFANITTDSFGAGSYTYPDLEDCADQGTPSVLWHTDIPTTFTATWGGNSVTEVAGTVVCSQL